MKTTIDDNQMNRDVTFSFTNFGTTYASTLILVIFPISFVVATLVWLLAEVDV